MERSGHGSVCGLEQSSIHLKVYLLLLANCSLYVVIVILLLLQYFSSIKLILYGETMFKKIPTNVFIREVLIPNVLNYTRKSKYPKKWFDILGGGLCFLNRPR